MSASYDPPEWMTARVLDVLGGRDLVIELMTEAESDETPPTFERALLVQDMYGKVHVLTRLHEADLLDLDDGGLVG
jgi:hypothetical protein